MFNLKLITPPDEPVVSSAELKDYLRIDNDIDVNRIVSMEAAAVKKLESYLDKKFITQTWDVYMDRWPQSSTSKWWDGSVEIAISEILSVSRNITLPIGVGIQLVEFSTYSDENEFIEDVSDYIFDSVGPRARVGLKLGAVWPRTILRASNGIRFRIKAGFGDVDAVPDDIKQAVKEFVAHMYENRGDQNEMIIPPHVLFLVEQYRRNKIGR